MDRHFCRKDMDCGGKAPLFLHARNFQAAQWVHRATKAESCLRSPGFWPTAILSIAVVLTGCASKGSARREAEKAMIATQQSAMAAQANQEPAVWFRGDVRNQRVPWTEGLTLAEALVTAHYTWNWDPRFISLTRNGEVHRINPKRLLRGQDNPILEPGDVIEVRH